MLADDVEADDGDGAWFLPRERLELLLDLGRD